MKRILWLFLLALLLCGCSQKPQREDAIPSTSPQIYTEPTEPAGIYVPHSDLEIRTGGTVRFYFSGEDAYGFRLMGSDLLVFSGEENTVLTRYAGEQMFPVAGTQLRCRIMPDDTSFQISANGITYYDSGKREVTFLDNDLKEVRRLAMSEDMVGKPVLSANRMQLYYCTADAVRVYDISTGLDKLLKTISYSRQSAQELLMGDTVLRCSLVDERGEEYSIFLSTQDGQMVSQIQPDIQVTTYGDHYYAKFPEGIQQMLVFGRPGEDAQMLTPADPFADSWYLEASNGLLTASVLEDRTVLDHYDLSTGLRTASVELPREIEPKGAAYCGETGDILVDAVDNRGNVSVILRWNKDADPVAEETVYTGPRYTAEDPDMVGLRACIVYAQELGETYGLDIFVGDTAVERQPPDYRLEVEYRPTVIHKQLETLESVLSKFPEGFFDRQQRKVTVCIVRSIQSNGESGGLAEVKGLQFWAKYDPYIALTAGDSLEAAFYHELFHVMDGKILSNTRSYYRWQNLNPDGFWYFGNYTSYRDADVSRYLQEEDRAFIDAYSMCYPKEDRAVIMEYACREGNEQYFQSEIMQNKLRTLCEGIRKAFGLEKYQGALIWEQYLKEPLVTK